MIQISSVIHQQLKLAAAVNFFSGASIRCGKCNRAIEPNVDAFSELFFAVHWQGMLPTSNSANLMSSC